MSNRLSVLGIGPDFLSFTPSSSSALTDLIRCSSPSLEGLIQGNEATPWKAASSRTNSSSPCRGVEFKSLRKSAVSHVWLDQVVWEAWRERELSSLVSPSAGDSRIADQWRGV